jgi:hypothetical protein
MQDDNEIKCLDCGSDEFKLMRTIPEQILTEYSKCGRPHLLQGNPVFFGDPSEY